MSFLIHLECPKCSATLNADAVQNLCACGSPLLARYDLEAAAHAVTPRDLAGRSASLWRYRELLPVRDETNIVSLYEGYSPILPMRGLGSSLGLADLWLKDEGMNPSGTFKAPGASGGGFRAPGLGG